MLTVHELRALVGDAGADLTDEQLQHLDAVTDIFAAVLAGHWRDRLDPAGAARRQQKARLQIERDLAPRRRRYEREKARAARRRTA